MLPVKTSPCYLKDDATKLIIRVDVFICFKVIDGGHGDLDINFDLSVDERVIYADFKKSDNIHRW